MRLLLDEQHDREVAVQLRRAGHDVVAVTERNDLLGLADSTLLVTAASERRALVTEDARDLALAHRQGLDSGRSHYGIILTSRRRYPRVKRERRVLIAALSRFLREHPREDELRDQTTWL